MMVDAGIRQPQSVAAGHGEEIRLAESIASGRGFVTPFQTLNHANNLPSMHSPPLFPFFQAGLLMVGREAGLATEVPYRTALALMIVITSAAIAILARAVFSEFGALAGWIAGIVGALWLPLVNNSVVLWDTPLVAAAACLATALLVRSRVLGDSDSVWAPLLFGFAGGLAMLANPAVAPLLAAVAVCVVLRKERGQRRAFLTLSLVAGLITLSPWMIRNGIEFGRPFLPVRGNFGLELWSGNRIGSDGSTQSTFTENFRESNMLTVAQLGEAGYVDQRQLEAETIIRNDPARFWRLTGRRFSLYWLGPYRKIEEGGPSPKPIGKTIANALFVVLGLGGLLLLPVLSRLGAGITILLTPIPYYITHVDITRRFRVPIEPHLVEGVAIAIAELWRLTRRAAPPRASSLPGD